jgi:hypothetical protein
LAGFYKDIAPTALGRRPVLPHTRTAGKGSSPSAALWELVELTDIQATSEALLDNSESRWL